MDERLPTALRTKYRLVHVPRQRRCGDWVRVATALLDEGLPPEQAGIIAAKRVFPYEAADRPLLDAEPVDTLLAWGSAVPDGSAK